MADVFATMLPGLYTRLGTPATHTAAAGGAITALRVLFDVQGGAGGIEGVMQGDSPQLRLQKASLPAGVKTGDSFLIQHNGGDQTWLAAERSTPLLDGEEWTVPVRKA